MAGEDIDPENSSQETREKREDEVKVNCEHCNKSSSCTIQCGKCQKPYHSSCLIQAATLKSAACRHVPSYACEEFWETEKGLYLLVIKHLEEKNQLLVENNELLKKNHNLLEEKLAEAENEVRKIAKKPQNMLASDHDYAVATLQHQKRIEIDANQVKNAINEAQRVTTMQNIQKLGETDDGWQIKKKHRRRRFVVGGNEDISGIQTVPSECEAKLKHQSIRMTDDKKKYNPMEPILNKINREYISLSDKDERRNKIILKELLDMITSAMKAKDTLFKEMFTRVFYGGSYYDGLRVGQPDEFDLDLLLSLPKILEPTLTTSNKPGFVYLQFNGYSKFLKQPEMVTRYKGLEKLMNVKTLYLETTKVLQWMQKTVDLAMNTFEKLNGRSTLKTSLGVFYAKFGESGPARTLTVEGIVDKSTLKIDIDLVPCFNFGNDKWPTNGFRENSVQRKPDFFIVPKPLKGVPCAERYWRLSFQEQERDIIDGKSTLKPTIKLLKRMRDILDHKCIASYYIKTLVIWEVSELKKGDLWNNFWNNSLSYVFMTILKDYHEHLNKKKIPYYWNKKNNLIQSVKEETLINIGNKVKAIIDDVDRHLEDPYVIAKYLLKPKELADFKRGTLSIAA